MTIVQPGQLRLFATADGKTVEVKKRGKHYVEPRGYFMPPGTGPKGETCGSCKHVLKRRYAKCWLARAVWTKGRGSDVLVRAPACSEWDRAE